MDTLIKGYIEVFSNMARKDVESFVQETENLPPKLRRLIKEKVCESGPKVFPISNWCTYKEVIKKKHASFVENAINNVIRGNEKVIVTSLGGLAVTGKFINIRLDTTGA